MKTETVLIGASKGISFTSKLIRYYQFGYPFTHAFYIHDLNTLTITEAWHLPLLRGGSVYYKIPFYQNHSKGTYVTVYSITVTEEQKRKIEEFLYEQRGKKYDFLGLLSFPLRRCNFNNINKWFCTELVYAAFKHSGVELLNDVSPCEVDIKTLLSSPLLKKVTEFSVT